MVLFSHDCLPFRVIMVIGEETRDTQETSFSFGQLSKSESCKAERYKTESCSRCSQQERRRWWKERVGAGGRGSTKRKFCLRRSIQKQRSLHPRRRSRRTQKRSRLMMRRSRWKRLHQGKLSLRLRRSIQKQRSLQPRKWRQRQRLRRRAQQSQENGNFGSGFMFPWKMLPIDWLISPVNMVLQEKVQVQIAKFPECTTTKLRISMAWRSTVVKWFRWAEKCGQWCRHPFSSVMFCCHPFLWQVGGKYYDSAKCKEIAVLALDGLLRIRDSRLFQHVTTVVWEGDWPWTPPRRWKHWRGSCNSGRGLSRQRVSRPASIFRYSLI